MATTEPGSAMTDAELVAELRKAAHLLATAAARIDRDVRRAAERRRQTQEHLSRFGPDIYRMRQHLAEHGEDPDRLSDLKLKHSALSELHRSHHPDDEG